MCCFFCLRKEQKSSAPLSKRQKDLIKEHFLPNFDDIESFLQMACCGSCKRIISLGFGNNPGNRPTNLPYDSDSNMH